MSQIYYNNQQGILAMKEKNKKAMLLKSEYKQMEEANGQFGEEQDKKHGIISQKAKYTGSDFHMTVQYYLSQNIDFRTHFKEKHKSKYN